MTSTCQQPLSRYQPMVAETQHQLIETIQQLPSPIRELALRHISARTTRAKGRQLLGEYVPWLIADLLEIRDIESVRRVALAWLHVYFFVLMVDDLIDQPRDAIDPRDFIVGSVLFQRGLSRLIQDFKYEEGLDSTFLDTALASLREIATWRERIRSLISPDPTLVGQKLALLRICSHALMNLRRDGYEMASNLDVFLEHLGVGIQLLDDTTDLDEDLRSGQLSYPLHLAAQRCQFFSNLSIPAQLNQHTLLLLVESGSLTDTLVAALEAFKKTLVVVQTINGNENNAVERYVQSLIGATSAALSIVVTTQRQLDQLARNAYTLISPKNLEVQRAKIVSEVRKAMELVAQST
jgi:hypothetical protein